VLRWQHELEEQWSHAHDLRHTVATLLEDAAIPSRVINELMGHASGRYDRGADGSPMGSRLIHPVLAV
jgi:integrase